jgi:hypothetical protein
MPLAGEKKKVGIKPDMYGLIIKRRYYRKLKQWVGPPYLVEPPYMEGNF